MKELFFYFHIMFTFNKYNFSNVKIFKQQHESFGCVSKILIIDEAILYRIEIVI